LFPLTPEEKLLEEMRSINPALQAVSFLNRADPVGADNQESREILTAVAGMTFAGVTIGNRKAFGKAVAQGLCVSELKQPDRKAIQEALALYKYVFGSALE
jgi:chromosome partitioning protein